MPPQLSLSSSYWADIKNLFNCSASPPNSTRTGLLRSLLVRSVRINLAQEGQVQLPLKVRPALITLNVLDLIVLGLLGFHPAGSSIPINDKVLHFGCFLLATALFYAVWDVDESARRHSALWRQMPLVLTFAVCFLVGGIGSEFIQSLLPYKRFDALDILANLFGSSLGLWLSYHAERRYRLDREVRRLYRPLDPEEYGDEVEEDFGLMDDGDEEGIDGDGNPQTRGASVCSVRQSQATVEAIRSGLEDVWCTASVEDTGARGVSSEPRYAGAGNDLFSIGAEEGEQDETETETRTSRGGHNESNCDMSSGGASARTPTDESQAAWGTVPSPSARLQ